MAGIKCHYCGRFVAYEDIHYESQMPSYSMYGPPDDVIVCGSCKVESTDEEDREAGTRDVVPV